MPITLNFTTNTGTKTKKTAKKQKSMDERKDMEAQICSMTSETAYLLGRLGIAKQKIRRSFIPCPRQLGDQVIPEDID